MGFFSTQHYMCKDSLSLVPCFILSYRFYNFDEKLLKHNLIIHFCLISDFEYCSYNYRSFDIANHFLEWVYDYTNEDKPFFYSKPENYPTEEQRLTFIKAYLKEQGSKEDPTTILKEVEVMSLASHFFWCLWSIVNAETSKIPFGYWEYGVTRLEAYFKLKKSINLPAVKRKIDSVE